MAIDPDVIIKLRDILYARQDGRCWQCGAALDWSTMQCAHIIPQRKQWLKRYGTGIIHHPGNFHATCPNDICNNAASLGNNRYLCDIHADWIRENNL